MVAAAAVVVTAINVENLVTLQETVLVLTHKTVSVSESM